MSDPELIELHEVAPAEVAELDLYQRREKIYTRKMEGFYQRVRLFTGWPLLLGYLHYPLDSVGRPPERAVRPAQPKIPYFRA